MREKILKILQEKGESTPAEISEVTGFSRQYVHKKLLELLESDEILKIGKPPLVFYQKKEIKSVLPEEGISQEDRFL